MGKNELYFQHWDWKYFVICRVSGIILSSWDKFGEGNGTPLQYSCLENPMGGGAWWAAVHGVARSWTRLSDFTFTSHFHALEKEMATHSSVLVWRIPGMAEPGGLLSVGSQSQTRLKRLSSSSSSSSNLILLLKEFFLNLIILIAYILTLLVLN